MSLAGGKTPQILLERLDLTSHGFDSKGVPLANNTSGKLVLIVIVSRPKTKLE